MPPPNFRIVEPCSVIVPAKLRAANNLILQLLAVVKVAIFGNIVVLERLSEGVVVGGL
jgi:hypothetical protein